MVWPCRLSTSTGEYSGSCSRGKAPVEIIWHRAREPGACCLRHGQAQGGSTLLLACRTCSRCWGAQMRCKLLLALVQPAAKTCSERKRPSASSAEAKPPHLTAWPCNCARIDMLTAHLARNAELAILVQAPGPHVAFLSQREAAIAAGGHLHHLQSSLACAEHIKAGRLGWRPSTQARRQVGHDLGCMRCPFPRNPSRSEQARWSSAAWPPYLRCAACSLAQTTQRPLTLLWLATRPLRTSFTGVGVSSWCLSLSSLRAASRVRAVVRPSWPWPAAPQLRMVPARVSARSWSSPAAGSRWSEQRSRNRKRQ